MMWTDLGVIELDSDAMCGQSAQWRRSVCCCLCNHRGIDSLGIFSAISCWFLHGESEYLFFLSGHLFVSMSINEQNTA
jgi:hypothetical protein